ncbi:hypothetical protein PSCFBP3800_03666 [Pseudomonas syringae group genomosp. 3]|uniref:Uncharacterized protein n=1 Tax=Pseudomonas syringae group genomosp. 3 TaxID=251701 RepID=A0A2K4WGA9_9PSED|nr:hypothetical protein CFBP6411_03568 [Pseudomonas syringae group genomosp. 3]SPF19131.1 hypothetical protein PSCFBP3800_03666 [Pseudomonas syringae group genomosp. 3]
MTQSVTHGIPTCGPGAASLLWDLLGNGNKTECPQSLRGTCPRWAAKRTQNRPTWLYLVHRGGWFLLPVPGSSRTSPLLRKARNPGQAKRRPVRTHDALLPEGRGSGPGDASLVRERADTFSENASSEISSSRTSPHKSGLPPKDLFITITGQSRAAKNPRATSGRSCADRRSSCRGRCRRWPCSIYDRAGCCR